jgi:type IV pilus assembly protein PilO
VSLRVLENLSDRNILIMGFLILVLLTIAYYFLLLNPLRQEYLARYEERTQKEAQEAQLEQTVAKLENVRRNAPNIERQILEYSKRIPEQDEIPTLVVQIEEVAEEAGVTQLSIEPGDPEAPPGGGDFSRIPLTMSFEGTYEEMQDFVLRIRNLARLVTVNGVTYCRFPQREGAECPIEQPREERGRTTRNGEDDLLTVEIAAEVYVQPAASEATTPAGETTAPAGGGAPKAGEGKAGKAGEGKAGGKS